MISQKIEIYSPILKTKFLYHDLVKTQLLKNINETTNTAYKKIDNLTVDKMRNDFDESDNLERKWLQNVLGFLQKHFNDCAKQIGFEDFKIINIWYQQYNPNGETHGWHTHGSNYTGVYYVDYDNQNGHTQFLYPCNLKNGFEVNVQEGDLILFPCNFIHRSAPNIRGDVKTIISFNLEIGKISPNTAPYDFYNIEKVY